MALFPAQSKKNEIVYNLFTPDTSIVTMTNQNTCLYNDKIVIANIIITVNSISSGTWTDVGVISHHYQNYIYSPVLNTSSATIIGEARIDGATGKLSIYLLTGVTNTTVDMHFNYYTS